MKIVHICLGCFYIEGMGYQENILPRKHAKSGHEVTVITSDYSFNEKGERIKKTKKDYINIDNVRVRVIDRVTKPKIMSKYSLFYGLYDELEKILPDIIFIHGGQFLSIYDVIKYAKTHRVQIYVDQHGDYYNMPLKNINDKIWQKVIFRFGMKRIARYTKKFYGVTPWRCQYLNEVYGIPKDKIELLVMGGEDDKIDLQNKDSISEKIRTEYGIGKDDFLIVTGGRIDKTKNIHLLMEAVSRLEADNVKLIVFGQPLGNVEEEIARLAENPKIRAIGWIPADEVYNYFLAADLVVFPGTHSVLWEQACACGLPGVFKYWEGMCHVDMGGNCEFLHSDSVEEIETVIHSIISDKAKYEKMKEIAQKGIKEFSYNDIARRAINEGE